MESVQFADLAREGLWVLLLVSAPLMLTALVVGLAVSLVQALTQIQESTLTFVPKMVAMMLVMALAMPYMLQSLQEYGLKLFELIATID